MVEKYVNEWIVGIEDITDRVILLKQRIDDGIDVAADLPEERTYVLKKALATALHLRYTDAKQLSILVVGKRPARSFNIFI